RTEGEMEYLPGEGTHVFAGDEIPTSKTARPHYMAYSPRSKSYAKAKRVKGKPGWNISGGGHLSTTLKRLRKEGLLDINGGQPITDDQIAVLQGVAAVESSGQLQTINSWDSDKMSVGFNQNTAAGRLQKLIRQNEGPWADYGIELDRDDENKEVEKWIKGPKDNKRMATGFEGMDKSKELRNITWGMRFYDAGLDDRIVVEQTKKAVQEYKADMARIQKRIAKSKKPNKKYFDELVVKAALFELGNNRPAYQMEIVMEALNSSGASDLKKFLKTLKTAAGKVYAKHAKPKKKAAMKKKGEGIVRKVAASFGH
ncbi:MAG: hypothetical protein AAF570_21065, partial [Bacteroidota bacterium]